MTGRYCHTDSSLCEVSQLPDREAIRHRHQRSNLQGSSYTAERPASCSFLLFSKATDGPEVQSILDCADCHEQFRTTLCSRRSEDSWLEDVCSSSSTI
nr:hypothetical protein CFP56_19640 [Quercus suber]